MKELLENPEKFRIGPNYKATNIIYPVEFEGEKYIVKEPRSGNLTIEAYYLLQDKFFYGTQHFGTVRTRSIGEYIKLNMLNGQHTPKTINYDFPNKRLIRELIYGMNFRNLRSPDNKRKTLEGAVEALGKIHEQEIALGDAHIKNTIITDNGQVYWLDLEGVYNVNQLRKVSAVDLLKLVYSTYTETKDEDLTIFAAETVCAKYPKGPIKDQLKELVTPGLSPLRLWFPTRLPLNGQLNKEIKRALKT